MKHKECDHPWQYVEVGYDSIDMCTKAICHKCGEIKILELTEDNSITLADKNH